MNKYLVGAIVLILLLVGGYLLKTTIAPKPENQETKAVNFMNEQNNTFMVDTEKSAINWAAQKVVGTGHEGTVDIKEGQLEFEAGVVKSAALIIDMNSIKDSKNTEQLIKHLKSDDFFSVETYPEAKFVFTAMSADGVVGQLTIKGISQEIVVPGQVVQLDGQYVFEASFTIDRTKWDIRYGSGKFFENLGDKMIKDDIQFNIKLYVEKT